MSRKSLYRSPYQSGTTQRPTGATGVLFCLNTCYSEQAESWNKLLICKEDLCLFFIRSVFVPYPDFALALLKWEMKFSFGTLGPAFPLPGWNIPPGTVIFYRTRVYTPQDDSSAQKL